jgi:ribosomal peptide maturation radical SAM protein 1
MDGDTRALLRGADVLLIEPAFAAVNRPSLSLHLLQALGEREGFRVRVLYANIWLAAEMGERDYQAICFSPTGPLIGERVFAHCAFGGSPRAIPSEPIATDKSLTSAALERYQLAAGSWIERIAELALASDAAIIGCTATFQQTTFSLALLSRIKHVSSDVITILGGASCEGPMGAGLYALNKGVDYIFSGESDEIFVDFLRDVRLAQPPTSGILRGRPIFNLDDSPLCKFSEYFAQISNFLPNTELERDGNILLPLETSRGCWWGQKHHCTFCGLNGDGMNFRQKSPSRAFEEIKALKNIYGVKKFFMVDNIMPHRYFSSLLPALEEASLGVELFYEQKSNLNLQRMMTLRKAGILEIQPGIESLSTSLLKKMKKGVTAAQNIETLRLARSLDIRVAWNILIGFPFEVESDYEAMPLLLSLLSHLEPPGCFGPISIDRFSPYFRMPHAYGIKEIRPLPAYSEIFPNDADIFDIAYHFIAEYPSILTINPDLVSTMERMVTQWQAQWTAACLPMLLICHVDDGDLLMVDTRELADTSPIQLIDEGQARAALLRNHNVEQDLEWAIDNKVAVVLEGQVTPLATASTDLLFSLKGC